MAMLVMKGIRKNADLQVMKDFILRGWSAELFEHFRLEEEILLPALPPVLFNSCHKNRLFLEHEAIRSIIFRLQEGMYSVTDITQFAVSLEQHIRFEERILFPEIEQLLPADVLEKIGVQLQHADIKNCMDYPVKFWE